MEMYKQASKLQLRFITPKGALSVEQLWGLSITDLSSSIKAVKKILKKDNSDDELSFLEDDKVLDVENQLRFDILKDIYLSKKKENEDLRNAADVKAHNQKIMDLIAKKKDIALEQLDVSELEKLIKS